MGSEMCIRDSQQAGHVVDVGGGVGHLSRLLGYGHNIAVACLDEVNDLNESANKFDKQLQSFLEKIASRNGQVLPPFCPPVHMTHHLHPDMDMAEFHKHLRQVCSSSEHTDGSHTSVLYGLIGLHTCGDLGPTLLLSLIHI